MTKASDNVYPRLLISEGGSTTTPAAATVTVYAKANGLLYSKDDAGTETALGGGGSGITVADEGGDLSTAATKLDFVGAGVVASGTGATKTITIAGAAGGFAPAQAVPYPTTFTGDTIDGSSATPFADVAAFDVKEVLNSRVLHLRTLGASKDQRVRVTLGTTKAAAFDVTTAFAYDNLLWSAVHDYYLEIKLSTAADGTLAIARLGAVSIAASGVDTHVVNTLRVGSTSISAVNTNIAGYFELGETVTLRIVRDGSDKLAFFYGHGTAPLALTRVKDIATSNVPYNPTSAGTLARVEYAMHTPSGPGATVQSDTYIDYLQSV